jgi:hypothetical protein
MRETSVRLLIVASDLRRFIWHQRIGFQMLRIITPAPAHPGWRECKMICKIRHKSLKCAPFVVPKPKE